MEITIKNITVEELKELLGIHEKPKKVKVRECSPYATFFDDQSKAWTKDPECNKFFLLRTQEFASDKLRAQGYLFLNEVYDMLGLRRTRAGQMVGWVYDVHNPVGDNYVDFNIFSDRNREFATGKKNSVLLDFNVDGDILDHL